ncbi:glycoside hydrolase family 2 TIM barrel-domain containing protein [Paenibacillus sp. Root444D2]|uniref:glycoside hydrolase family 2 TIM barrel-domain containing protein n=1 Tax=Paenibacillus sp. Root444D2 TaxID=1736538 RepID=UPI00070A148A|nr:glycoside hydrolase family 2 TIM barrel-domain containing protein [Paenibacillus sp. Root444D2]KQX68350.1 beta-galactosidase [Paenibacillus sp. Root444D2]
MKLTKPNLSWLTDVGVFAENRLPAHSDHRYYETLEEAEAIAPMALRHDLNGSWKFNYSGKPADRPELFHQLDYECGSWSNIEVPGHIQLQGYGKPQYVNTMYPWDGHHDIRPPAIPEHDNPVGSYVKYFTLPDHMKGRPVYISFQGVESAFYLWLNGEFIGYSEDSFTPAEFDLTPFLQEGENKLAVEVYQRSTGSWLEDQDFWRFSGIFRDVYLYTVPSIHVRDLFVHADLDAAYENGSLRADIKLADRQEAAVYLELKDAAGHTVGTARSEVSTIEAISLSMDAGQVTPWSAEKPYLYVLYVSVYDQAGKLVEVISQRVGFRKFEMINKIMHLNGKRIVFKGVNRHEFNSRRGRAITKEDMLWDIATLKRNNLNAVRTSHYPNQSLWYELCDIYGIYVIDEMNLETHGSWQKMGAVEPSWNIPANKPEWQDIVMDRAISMVERDKNHPSILIWSVGNEAYAGEVLLNVSNYFREKDPSRLVHYEGVFHNRKYNDTSDMESRMYAKPLDIEAYLNDNPQKPYISCEYMHAMGNSVGGMHKYTELEQKYAMYQGGFIWDYIDQVIVKKDRYGKEFLAFGGDFGDRATDYNFCTNGIVYADRKVSPKMQEVKFLYQNIKLVPDRQGVKVTNENLFEGTEAYDLLVVLHKEGKEIFRGKRNIDVPAQSEAYVTLELPSVDEPGEYVVHASLNLKESTLWAEAGHEVSFGQYVFLVDDPASSAQPEGSFRVVDGDVNIGVHGRDFSIMFSKQAGSLISLNYAGREMIAIPPAPLFWRATTDNDKGFSLGFDSGAWYAASLTRKCIGVELTEQAGSVTVTFQYKLSISADVLVTVAYTVYADGSLNVKSRYEGATGLPKLPIFALSFKVPADYFHLDWYAMGPEENYIDRAFGARLGVFKNDAADNVSGYVVPQESGNRTGVRRVNITNNDGHGIRITAPAVQPVECNISPFTAFELENAYHHYELPNVHYTVVTVAGRQMGVGGDDSWGAPVHDEYLIKADQDLAFEFNIHRL